MNTHSLKMEKKKHNVSWQVELIEEHIASGAGWPKFFYVSISDWKNMSMCLHMGLLMTF